MQTTSLLLIAGLLILSLTTTAHAALPPANIEIQTPRILLNNTEKIGNRTIGIYDIFVPVSNAGRSPTDNITFTFIDPEIHANITLGSAVIGPGQTYTFVKHNYPIGIPMPYYFNITYRPTNRTVNANEYNSGERSFLHGGAAPTPKKSTPGFEWGIMALAVIIALAVYRRR